MTSKEFARIYKMKSGKDKTLVESNKDVKIFIETLIEIFKDASIDNLSFEGFGKFYVDNINRTYTHPITKKKKQISRKVLKFKSNLPIIEIKGIEE